MSKSILNKHLQRLSRVTGISQKKLAALYPLILDIGGIWRCPRCDRQVIVGYQELADIGVPLCDCEDGTEMVLADECVSVAVHAEPPQPIAIVCPRCNYEITEDI